MDAPSRFRLFFVFVLLLSSLTAEGQVPEDVRRKLLAFGFGPSLEPSMEIYGRLLAALLVVAEYDQRNLVETTGELFVALCQRDDGRCPRFLPHRHHNQLSEVFHINTGDELLGREILDFVEEGAERQRERARAR